MKPEPFGKYTLLDWLAAGGMGEVFLAKAGPKGFERFFAIKRILAQHAESPEFVAMMMNEARISVQLNHPNIAQVFEFGQHERHFFMAMEYVEGISLSAMLRRGRERDIKMKPADAVFVALQVLRGLQYAHTKLDMSGKPLGIVHRDVSPHNILLDETGSVKLIDFGIARAAESLVKTEADAIKGKIPYMSPEQAKGMQIDARSDLYALGVVLFESLAYQPMHASPNTLETLKNVQQGAVPPLPEKLGGIVPDSLIMVLVRALEREPTARYPDAAEMEKALALCLHELEPGYTSQRLARIVRELDVGRDSRKALIKTEAGATSEAPARAPPVELESRPLTPAAPAVSPTAPTRTTLQQPPSTSRAAMLVGVAAALVIAAIAIVVLRPTQAETPVVVAPPPPVPAPVPPPPLPPPVVAEPPIAPVAPKTRSRSAPPREPAHEPKAPAPTGCVTVAAKPWAHVVVGGKRVGTTPLRCVALPPGKHEIKLENPALGSERVVVVEVKAGETSRVSEQM